MIKEMLYQHFDKIRIEKENREKSIDNINFAPSYIDKCKRQIFYNKTNVPASNPMDSHTYIKFEMGNSVHESLQNILKEMGIYKDGEDFKNITYADLEWIYRIDGLLEIDNEKHIIEIKTVYASGYNSIENEAKPEHERQLLLYMLFENIEYGVILYIGRDNGFIVEYNYDLDSLYKKHAKYLNDKFNELIKLKILIEKNYIPDRDFQITLKNNNGIISDSFQMNNKKYKSDWQCSKKDGKTYCQWRDLCWQDELKEIHNHKFYINGEFHD